MKQRWGLIAFVAVISFLSGGWLLQRGVASGGNVYQQARLFDDVLGHVSAYYVDSIGETDLYERATRGMLEQLKDPYSVLLTGEDYRALTEQTSGNYAGLGIQIDVRDGWITVVAPLPETPAERAGVATISCLGSRNRSATCTPWSSNPPGLKRRSRIMDFIPFCFMRTISLRSSWAEVSATGVSWM
jgi:hypothetical protein